MMRHRRERHLTWIRRLEAAQWRRETFGEPYPVPHPCPCLEARIDSPRFALHEIPFFCRCEGKREPEAAQSHAEPVHIETESVQVEPEKTKRGRKDREERNRDITRRHEDGESYAELSRTFQLSTRQVGRIVRAAAGFAPPSGGPNSTGEIK